MFARQHPHDSCSAQEVLAKGQFRLPGAPGPSELSGLLVLQSMQGRTRKIVLALVLVVVLVILIYVTLLLLYGIDSGVDSG